MSARTVRCRWVEAGLYSYIAVRKPHPIAINRKERLQWAISHQHWTVDDRSKVVFSDEVAIHFVQTNQRRYIRHRMGVNPQPCPYQPRLQAGGGSVMVWGAFTLQGSVELYRVTGSLNAQ